ncbi:MAG: type II secretion system F family protein [Solirubrobacterales bacterium]
MSGAGLLAACSVLLAVCAARELAAWQPSVALGGRLRRRWRWVARAVTVLGVHERLVKAGLSGRVSAATVLIARGAGSAIGLLIAPVAAPAAPGRLSWLLFAGLPAAGFLAPDALLERLARKRREQLIASLPDALDLLAVSAASGRSTAAGLAQIAAGGEGPLATELAVAVAEISAGMPQERALAALRQRVSGSELAALVATIERSRRYGSPLADQLRRQAASLRTDKRRAVQERAARAAPKIQLVVALILVPSVLLMIAAGLIANSDRLLAGF